MYALFEAKDVFVARREVERKQDTRTIDLRKELEQALHFARTHAIEIDALSFKRLEQLTIWIGLHRKQHFADAGQFLKSLRALKHGCAIVNICRCVPHSDFE